MTVTRVIDSHLDELGMDLAEESVYLLFDRAPGAILAGEGQTMVARSVIGPKKNLSGELKQVDWIQAPVFRKVLISNDWDLMLGECLTEWENLQRKGEKLASDFMIVAKRRLLPELTLTVEVLFHE